MFVHNSYFVNKVGYGGVCTAFTEELAFPASICDQLDVRAHDTRVKMYV